MLLVVGFGAGWPLFGHCKDVETILGMSHSLFFLIELFENSKSIKQRQVRSEFARWKLPRPRPVPNLGLNNLCKLDPY